MRRFIIMASAAAAAFCVCAARPAPAAASFQICNNSGENLSVAIAYHDQSSGNWVSRGWWNLSDGDCKTPLSGSLTNQYYYLYADGDDHTWTGSSSFCVDSTHAFTLNEADTTCDYNTERFFEVDTGDATGYTYTFK